MIVNASGGVVVREHADGRSIYSMRSRSGHRREMAVLGGPEDGWTAAIEAALFVPPPGPPTRETHEALRRRTVARVLRRLDRRRHA